MRTYYFDSFLDPENPEWIFLEPLPDYLEYLWWAIKVDTGSRPDLFDLMTFGQARVCVTNGQVFFVGLKEGHLRTFHASWPVSAENIVMSIEYSPGGKEPSAAEDSKWEKMR